MPRSTPRKTPTRSWSLQDAKAHFSKLVRETLVGGPQLVTRNGEEVVMIVSVHDFRKFASRHSVNTASSSTAAAAHTFGQFLARSPLVDVELDIARPRDPGRDLDL